MHHISNDKRAKQSAELVYRGLLRCLKGKQFDRITISDLQKASGVARSTFYRAFDNISDVLYWKCDESFREVLGSCDPRMFASELELAEHYFTYWAAHSDILELLVKINRHDIIYACHMRNAEILKKRFGAIPGMLGRNGNYFIAIRTGFTISVLTAWLDSGQKESPSELVEIVREQLSFLAQ